MFSLKTAAISLLAATAALAAPAPVERAGAPEIYSHLQTINGGNFCLDLRDGVVTNGTAAQLWECVYPNDNQLFTGMGSGRAIHSTKSWSLVLDAGLDPQNGSKVHFWQYYYWNTSPYVLPQQDWEWVQTTWGPYNYLKLRNYDLCLDVTDGGFYNGNQLQVWKCTQGPNQLFKSVPLEQAGKPYNPPK